MSTVFLNGQFLPAREASISVMDRGFLFADGVYEVIPVYGSKLFRLQEHLARLDKSLQAIHLRNPMTLDAWQEMLTALVEKNGGGHLSVYLQVTRGVMGLRDHCFEEEYVPTIYAMANPMPIAASEDVVHAKGERAITADDIRWKRCDIKAISLLPNILLKQQAKEAAALEALLLRNGCVTEGSASNIFIVKSGKVLTPRKDNRLLGGITRDLILELLAREKIEYAEEDISEQQLRSAEEIWVTSSTKEIVPIISLDGQVVGSGEIGVMWKRVANLYQIYKQQLMGGLNENPKKR